MAHLKGRRDIDGSLIKTLRRRLGMTQRQLAERLGVDQGTVSRWEREVESPRPNRRAALSRLLLKDESRRAMLRSMAFVQQDYRPATILNARLQITEISASGERHFRVRGADPDTLIGMTPEAFAARFGAPEIEEKLAPSLTESGLLKGEALLFRFVSNHDGNAHATIYEPIFEDGALLGVLNYVSTYFDLPRTGTMGFELIDAVTVDDPTKARTLYRGAHAEEAQAALRQPRQDDRRR